MSGLAESSLDESPVRTWATRAGIALGGLALLALLFWGLHSLSGGPAAPKRQTVKIALLPDVPPPPPPPPPKEEKQPEPKVEQKPIDTPKQDKPPEPEQIKMEGPAGDAPSPFAGGVVKNDYIGGDIGSAMESAMAKYAYYTNRLTEHIQDDLSRKKLHSGCVRVYLWIEADGTIRRYKLSGSSGDPENDRKLETAIADLGHVREAPPADMPMPVGLQISMP
jgi:protein TonB